MPAAIRCFVLVCVAMGSYLPVARAQRLSPERVANPLPGTDCGAPTSPPPSRDNVAAASSGLTSSVPWGCLPPYQTPVYSPPPDDGVALSSLIDASGYSRGVADQFRSMVAGDFCGDSDKEIFVVTNHVEGAGRPPHLIAASSNFSLLQGPVPHFLKSLSPIESSEPGPIGPWHAAAAANLDPGQQYDQIVLLRPNAKRAPNLAVLKVRTSRLSHQNECTDSSVLAQTLVGDSTEKFAGAAVGNFDGRGGKTIAILDSTHSIISLLELHKSNDNPPTYGLDVVFTQQLEGDLARPGEWNALVAGDLDSGGEDELVAARHISDSRRPTVVAFRWDGTKFVQFAKSDFGFEGNSQWAAATAGDFNADHRYSVVLAKNKHSNFAVLDLPIGATELKVRTTGDLDSVDGQPWVSLAATDWLGGDQGAAELIAFRRVALPYRTNFFVYGNPFHRVQRDTGLDGTKAQWVQHLNPQLTPYTPSVSDLKAWLRATHTNVFNWHLSVSHDASTTPVAFSVHDYTDLVNFLSQTQNWGVDGRQLRVWVTISRSAAVADPTETCATPEDTTPLTSFNALDYFKGHFTHDYDHLTDDEKMAACRDLGAWSAVLGRLAQDFPHLVAFGIDDMADSLDTESSTDCLAEFEFRQKFNQDCFATIESNLRSQAPWLNFVPTVYYPYFQDRFSSATNWADMALTLDSMQFFFRNQKQTNPDHECIDNTLICTQSVENAPGEIRDMHQLLPAGRKIQVGVYFVGCGGCGTNAYKPPQIRYDYDMVRIAMDMPIVGGVTAYGLQTPPWIQDIPGSSPFRPCTGAECKPHCTEQNFLIDTDPPGDAKSEFEMFGTDRYCALAQAFGAKPQPVTESDLTPNGPTSASKVSAYFDPVEGIDQVYFRSGDGHIHELWRTSGPIGQGDLTPNGANAVNDPTAYFVPTDGTHHVIFRSSDGHVRELRWSGPDPATPRDLQPGGAMAVGSPAAAFLENEGSQHAVYASTNGHLHELFWTGSGAVGQGDLTPAGPIAASNPSIYSVTSDASQHVIYRGQDNRLHELTWVGSNPPGRRVLTPGTGYAPLGDAFAYFSAAESTEHVLYRSTDLNLHELHWINSAPENHVISLDEVASPPDSNLSGYYVPSGFMNHAVYRSADGHIHELVWHRFTVTHRDLTALVDAPNAVGDPAAYFFSQEGAVHVFYRTSNGHLHQFRWSD
jgi:hypothetical protein